MTNVAPTYIVDNVERKSNVISFPVVREAKSTCQDANDNKAPSPCKGKSSEVYAFRTRDEIASMIDIFDRHIRDAEDDDKRKIAYRNKMLFVVGINVGVRASDLRLLKLSFFFNEDGTHKDSYKIQPMKTRNKKKFVTMYFNDAVKTMIDRYVTEYPYDSLDDYLFASRKGDEPISVRSMCRIIKDAASEAGIEQNIGSHSLRKTFGRFCFESSEDKTRALVVLQKAFNHSDSLTTLRYIGLLGDEISEMYNDLNLGLDSL